MTLESTGVQQIPIEGIITHQTRFWLRGCGTCHNSTGDPKAHEEEKLQSDTPMNKRLRSGMRPSPNPAEAVSKKVHYDRHHFH
jgi:hypothetical protein